VKIVFLLITLFLLLACSSCIPDANKSDVAVGYHTYDVESKDIVLGQVLL